MQMVLNNIINIIKQLGYGQIIDKQQYNIYKYQQQQDCGTVMLNKTAIGQHVDKYIKQIHDLYVIIISDYEGVHIYSAYKQSIKDKLQKIIQTSTMIICTISQCQGNFNKIGNPKTLNPITYYYDQYLIHFRKNKHFMVTLFMNPKASELLADDISMELSQDFNSLNNIIPKVKNQ